jgi:hypothetical protein
MQEDGFAWSRPPQNTVVPRWGWGVGDLAFKRMVVPLYHHAIELYQLN